VALATAWIGYPAPVTHAVAGTRASSLVGWLLIGLALWTVLVAAGRPLPAGRTAALQWAQASSLNNIRPWMQPVRAPWLDGAPALRE
jgi:hypothetical protein